MTSAVQAVLLDIDDTICTYERTAADILPVAFDRVGVDPFFTAAEYHDRYGEFTDESDDMQDLRERCFAAFADERGHDPAIGREIARIYAAERNHANVRFLPGAREAVEALADAVPLAAVTNGAPEMQSTKLRALGVDDRFQTVVHGGYDAPAKPAPDPFYEALDVLGTAPEETVHVGNSLTSDVAGAKAAGVQAAWLKNGTDEVPEEIPDPDYVLDSMADVPDRWG